VDSVRQGALIAASMILMQNSSHEDKSRLSEHRKLLEKVTSDKHEDTMAKFGAIIATGLLDAGGRNMTISLVSKSGHKAMPAIIGCGVFTHFWFWHPLTLFVNLALTPTAAIGVNSSLQMPTWRFKSHATPSTFAYPPPRNDGKKEEVAVAAAVLSITGKKKSKEDSEEAAAKAAEAKAAAEKLHGDQVLAARNETLATLAGLKMRGALPAEVYKSLVGEKLAAETEKAEKEKAKMDAKKDSKEDDKKEGASSMSVDDDASKPSLLALYERVSTAHAKGKLSTSTLMATYAHKPPPPTAEGAEQDPHLVEPKLDYEILENPARVLRMQERVIASLPDSRYIPISTGRRAGIIVLKDTTPDQAEDLLLSNIPMPGGANPDEEEPDPPAPFEFVE